MLTCLSLLLRNNSNVIQVNVSGASPNYAGEIPFRGSGPPYQSVELNDAYWRHIDRIVAAARDHGIYVAVFAWWGDAADKTFAQPKSHNYQYGQALGARYGDQPNIIWVSAGEFHKPNTWKPPLSEEHLANLVRLVEGIRQADSGQHLVAMHPLSFLSSSSEFHQVPWLDLNMVQSHIYPHCIADLVGADWNRMPPKPTLNAEPWYEGEEGLFERRAGLRLAAGREYDIGWIQRYQSYWSVFFGSVGYTYGHMNLWCMHPTRAYWEAERSELNRFPGQLLDSALDAPGSADLRHLRKLIESGPFLSLMPDASLITQDTRGMDATLSPNLRCATRTSDGTWALVYSTRGEIVGVEMSRLASGHTSAAWYNPRNGRWWFQGRDLEAMKPFEVSIIAGPGAPDRSFVPPCDPADGNDWVLALAVEAIK